MKKTKLIIISVLIISLIIFIAGNRDAMDFWFFHKFMAPKFIVILICTIIGFIGGFFIGFKKKK